MKNYKIYSSYVSPEGMIFILIFVEICNTMLYMSFQWGWKLVLIQRILIGFEAVLDIYLILGFGLSLCYVAAIIVVAYYFDRRRSFATGISVCGSGVGKLELI